MAMTIGKFVKDGEYHIMKTQNRKSPPVVLSANEIERLRQKLIAKICANAPKRPRPGGALSHPTMWQVKGRNLKGKSASAYQFEVTAVRESPLEEGSIFQRGDRGRSTPGNRQHYAWWVEFGHKVHSPKGRRRIRGRSYPIKLPFVLQGGKLWRVNVEGYTRSKSGQRYRVLMRPIWDDWGEFTKRSMVPVNPQYRNTGKVNGRQYRRRTNGVLWFKPGTRTDYVPGEYFVKKALNSMSQEMFETLFAAATNSDLVKGMHPSVKKMWAKRKPVGIVTEDHYDTQAQLTKKAVVEGMYSLVIKEGK